MPAPSAEHAMPLPRSVATRRVALPPYRDLMVCVFCGLWAGNLAEMPRICPSCAHSLRPFAERRLPAGILVRSAFAHDGAARRAVHALKYQAVEHVAAAAAPVLAALVPPQTTHLVPVPRALSRRMRFGIDTAAVLADHVARLTGTPVVRGLRAPVIHVSQVRRRRMEGVQRFRQVAAIAPGAVLVDDVVTTGATLAAAAGACATPVSHAVTMTGVV